MSKCPPGVLCITHVSLIFSIMVGAYLVYLYGQSQALPPPQLSSSTPMPQPTVIVATNPYPGPTADPGVPPLRRQSYNFTQQGILKSQSNPNRLLPLMGRILHRSRDTWSYYTFKDGNNLMKLPIMYKKKNCTGEYGCDRIFSNDTVYVEGLDEPYTAIIYDNDCFRYSAM